MSTLSMLKSSQTTFQSNWKTTFPDFTTLTGSCQFIKKLMAVSVSALTYLRGIFPDNAYGEKNLCGIKLKLLTEDSGIDAVDKFIDFVRGCYDAIDKKYLEQVCIGICSDPENREEVLESYNINFRYRDDEYIVSTQSTTMKLEENGETVQATFMLLKCIYYMTDVLDPLPKEAFLTMKLIFNETTPPEYQPPGFEPSSNEKFFFPPNAVKLELGKIRTDFNQYKMTLKTALSKEPLSQIFEESVQYNSQQSNNNAENDQENYSMPSQGNVSKKSDRSGVSKQINEEKIQCVCGCKENSGTEILQCGVCGKKQHSVCYGILNSHEAVSKFYCTDCSRDASRNNLEEDEIYKYDEFEQNQLSAFRRALVFCASLKQVTASQLEKGLKCNKKLAKDLITKLEVEDFIKKSGHKYIVNEKMIKQQGYWMYFRRNEDNENMEKTILLTEKDSDESDFEKENIKRKTSVTANKKLVSEDGYMNFPIEDEVEKLTLRKQEKKTPRPRNSKLTKEEDFEEAYQRNLKRRKCVDRKEIISLKE